MKNPASSFRAKRVWYREPWPWLLMAGPGIVVIACLGTAWLAYTSDDGVVATDYYKQGLMFNRRIPRADSAPAHALGATIAVTAAGDVRARIEGLVDAPPELHLRLTRLGGEDDEIVRLTPTADGDYIGNLSARPAGRWIVTLESRTWRLPTTISDRLAEVRLGSAERRPIGTE